MNEEELIRLVDHLEDVADGYVTLSEVQAAGADDVRSAIADGVLVIDHRTGLDGSNIMLCRLNRHHPHVKALTAW